MAWLLLVAGGLLAAWALAWLSLPRAAPAPATAGDPYEAEVGRFRRELHDWTRDA